MSIICPNIYCKNADGVRTTLHTDANYCFACGRAVSEKAIEKQKREINNIRNRKLSDANNKILFVENQISDSERKIKQFEIEIKSLTDDNFVLENKLKKMSDNLANLEVGKCSENNDIKYPLIGLSIILVFIVLFVIKHFVVS